MENRFRFLLLSVAVTALCGCAHLPLLGHRHAATDAAPASTPAASTSGSTTASDPAASGTAGTAGAAGDAPQNGSAGATDQNPPAVVEPQVQRRTIKVPKIHSSNVELGIYYGELSIENFGTQPVAGLHLDYHVTEDFFFEGSYGQARAGQTSFELLSGGIQLLSDAERRFTYYNLSLGYNMLPGEIFIGHDRAMTSALYLIGGIGSIKFAGNQNFSVNFGAGFRVLPTDWLALHIDVQDLVYRTNVFSVYQLTNNLQATVGASVFF